MSLNLFPLNRTASNVVLYTITVPKYWSTGTRSLSISVPISIQGQMNSQGSTGKLLIINCPGAVSGKIMRDGVFYRDLSFNTPPQYINQYITTTAVSTPNALSFTLFWQMVSFVFYPPTDTVDRTYQFTCNISCIMDAGTFNNNIAFQYYPNSTGFLINVGSGGASFNGFAFYTGYQSATNFSALSYTDSGGTSSASYLAVDYGRVGQLIIPQTNRVSYAENYIIRTATTLAFPLNTLYSVSNAGGAYTITLPRITASNVGTEITFRKSVATAIPANTISFLANYPDTYLYKLGSDASFNTAQALMASTVYSISFVAMNKTTEVSPQYGWFQTYTSGTTAVPQTVDDYTCYSNIEMDIGAVWNYSVLPTAPIIPTSQFQLINKYYADNNFKSNTDFDASFNQLISLLPATPEVIFRTTNANFTMTTFPVAVLWNLASSGTTIQCYLPTITSAMIGKKCVFKKYNQTTNYSLTINAPSGVSMVVSNNGNLVSTITLGNTSYFIELMVVSTTLLLGM